MPKKHPRYIINDTSVPGVTTILSVINKPGLNAWRGRLGNEEADRVMREGMDFGDRLHSAIDQQLEGQKITPDDDLADALANLWKTVNGWEFGETEKEVLNFDHKYGGTIDAIATVGGKKKIVDFKTSSDGRAWPEHELQVTAYMDCLDIKEAILLYLNKKTNGWSSVIVPFQQDTFDVFLAAKTIYDWRQATKS